MAPGVDQVLSIEVFLTPELCHITWMKESLLREAKAGAGGMGQGRIVPHRAMLLMGCDFFS